jgi:CubicO group peptidase (beta-lactamase class C family)
MHSSHAALSRRHLVLSWAAAVAAAALPGCGGGDDEAELAARDSPELQAAANDAVRAGLVGVAVGRLTPDVRYQQAAGLRRLGHADTVRRNDLFLIGSITKAMTAQVAARLVERGVIDWSTTLAQALPDLAPAMQGAYRGVTLEQLLAHRGGVMAFNRASDMAQFMSYLGKDASSPPVEPAARQGIFAAWVLGQPVADGVVPGQDFLYSNAGYALAAMMLEARTGRVFSALAERELNEPLGFSLRWVPADQVANDRPSGHAGPPGGLAVLAPEDSAQARWFEVLHPAGKDAAVTPDGYARWLRWHLLALQNRPTPLPPGYLQRLRKLAEDDYALGWYGLRVDGRPVLGHDGVVAGFCSIAAVDVAGQRAAFAFTNTSGTDDLWPLDRLNALLLDVEQRLQKPG